MTKAKRDTTKTQSFDEFMAKHSGIVNQPANPAVTGFHLLVLEHGGNISLADVMKGPRRELAANEIESRLVNQWWPVRLLREAAKESSPDPFRTLLEYILREIGAKPPVSVLMPLPGKPGRPIGEKGNMIYLKWIDLRRPMKRRGKLKPDWNRLARECFPAKFKQGSAEDRIKLANVCRQAVSRREPKNATKSSSN